MRPLIRWAGGAMALAAAVLPASAKEFTLADLQKMVRELEAVSAKNPAYKYPIKCGMIVEDQTVNAHATFEKSSNGEKPQAVIELFTGLVKECNGNEKLIRAVIAHEVAHLAKGHVKATSFSARDLQHFWVRQIEHEADVYGAELLIKAGYSKQDMVDMLGFLDNLRPRKRDWLQRTTSDHATPKARISKIVADPHLMRVLVQFDYGLVFMESRRYNIAAEMFEVATKMEPKLLDAWTNRAQSKLLFYWENLPGAFVARTFRPDFGPFILTPESPARGNEITDQNRAMYKEAVAAIDEAIAKRNGMRERELKAIAQILNPDADKALVRQGMDTLSTMKPADPAARLRFMNNVVVGHVILGEAGKGYEALVGELRTNRSSSSASAENIGRFRLAKGSRSGADLKLTQSVLSGWLERTPSTSPAYKTVYEGYSLVCQELNEQPKSLLQSATLLAPAVSMFHKGKELGLLQAQTVFESAYGKPQLQFPFLEEYPEITYAVWEDGAYAAVFEGPLALRILSYATGDYLVVKPEDETSSKDYIVRVGMKVEEVTWYPLEKYGFEREMVGRKGLEKWRMFPGLNFGVLIDKGTIVGITVSDYAPLTREG